MEDVKLIPAHGGAIPEIRHLASVVWNQYYPAIISLSQIHYMLNLMYSEQSLKKQIEEEKHQFFIIQCGGKNCGFISVQPTSADKWKLHKFYVDQSLASNGIGTKVFSFIRQFTKAQEIVLTVNRQNFKAINFYFKCGFKIDHAADFDIGQGYVMNDFVMKWTK